MAKVNTNTAFVKGLLESGKTEEEVLKIMEEKYIQKGKTPEFAKKRAKVYLKLAKK